MGTENMEASPGTEVLLLWQLLPEEDIKKSTKWFPLKICIARSAGLGGS